MNFKESILEGEQLKALLSPYWDRGYKSDTHNLEAIRVSGKVAEGHCKMAEYFISPTDPRFHLSIFNATTFLCQIGIAHALFLNDYDKKNVEVLMTEFNINLTKQIFEPNGIPIRMEIFTHSVTPPKGHGKTARTFYKWKFEVAEGAWWGTIALCFPFQSRGQAASAEVCKQK